MTIEIGEGRFGTIEVRDGDNTLELASSFCVMHRLPVDGIVEPLSYSIEKTLQSVIRTKPLNSFLDHEATSRSALREEDLQFPPGAAAVSFSNTSTQAGFDSVELAHGQHRADLTDEEEPPAPQGDPRGCTPAVARTAATDPDAGAELPEWYQQLCEKAIRQVEKRRRQLSDTSAAASRPGVRRRFARPGPSESAASHSVPYRPPS